MKRKTGQWAADVLDQRIAGPKDSQLFWSAQRLRSAPASTRCGGGQQNPGAARKWIRKLRRDDGLRQTGDRVTAFTAGGILVIIVKRRWALGTDRLCG
jgi:hypothetical protein